MNKKVILTNDIEKFCLYLAEEEKSVITIEKYCRDVKAFAEYMGESYVSKAAVVAYKKQLESSGYAVSSINSMLASVNSFMKFMGLFECTVKNIKRQKQSYCSEEKELTIAEYKRLLNASQKNEQLNLILQTIAELYGITVEELCEYNELQPDAVLVAGQQIAVPVVQEQEDLEETENTDGETDEELTEDEIEATDEDLTVTDPDAQPEASPTVSPSVDPTAEPTQQPTGEPTATPTTEPSTQPTVSPDSQPTDSPATTPTVQPAAAPTAQPTAAPTQQPAETPAATPVAEPAATPAE